MRISDWSSDVCSSDLKGTAERINQLIVAITWYDNARKRGTDLPAHYRSHHRKVLGGLTDIIIVQNHGGSEEHTSELQSLMRISYAVFCLKAKNYMQKHQSNTY